MSDVVMCKGGDCPMKKKCERYTSKAKEVQEWFPSTPFKFSDIGEGAFCSFFIKNSIGEKVEEFENGLDESL